MKKHLILLLIIIVNLQICKPQNSDKNNSAYLTLKSYYLSDTIDFTDFNIYTEVAGDYNYTSKDSIFWERYLTTTKVAKVGLTKMDKRNIYNLSREIDFLNLPDTLIKGYENCVVPAFYVIISIQYDKKVHKVFDNGYCKAKDKSIGKRFDKIQKLILDIIWNKSEVIALPKTDIINM
jgi:hypothetical protein